MKLTLIEYQHFEKKIIQIGSLDLEKRKIMDPKKLNFLFPKIAS